MKYQQVWFRSRPGNYFLRISDYVMWVDLEPTKRISAKVLLGLWEYDIERIHGNLDAEV